MFIVFASLTPAGATNISGALSGTLSISGSPYTATANISIASGQSLSIDPGVVIMMSPSTNFTINGTLSAPGTPGTPIIISSLQEGTTSAAPGQWGALQFVNSTPSTQLTNVFIRYGQQVTLSAAAPQWNNVTISSMSVAAVVTDLTSALTGSNISAFGSPVNGIDLPGGVVSASTTWTGLGIPYIIASREIIFQAPLTIGAGAIIKLSSVLNTRLHLESPLTVQGTSATPVIFTSLKDDSVGGDTNGDGSATSPAPGDWQTLLLDGAAVSGSHMDHLILRYGGAQNSQDMQVQVSTGLVLTNSEISFSGGSGLLATPGNFALIQGDTFKGNTQWGAVLGGDSAAISNNVFDGNGSGGIQFGVATAGAPALSGNTFQNNAVAIQIAVPNIYPNDQGRNVLGPNNKLAGIDITAAAWSQGGTWNFLSMPYVIRTNEVVFVATAPLTIAPGVVVKLFGPPRLHMEAPLTAIGTISAPITFTSLKDDSVAGDTNGDGSATLPAPGDSESLVIDQATASGSQLTHVIMRYGDVDLVIDGATTTVTSCDISRSGADGIRLGGSGGVLITGTTLQLNVGDGLNASGGLGTTNILQSSIIGNQTFGVQGGGVSNPVNAQNNYWGSPTGPTSASNPGGTGDKVSANVNFTPFLTVPPGPPTPSPGPTGLTAVPGDTIVDLSWSAGTSAVRGYNVYRDSSTVPLNGALVPGTQLGYRDFALTDGRTYNYTITSINVDGVESLPSLSVQATPVAGSGWGQ